MNKRIIVNEINLHTYYDFVNASKSSNCAICDNSLLHKFNLIKRDIIVLGKCGHMFHKSCINQDSEYMECPYDNIIFENIKELDSEIIMKNNELHLKTS